MPFLFNAKSKNNLNKIKIKVMRELTGKSDKVGPRGSWKAKKKGMQGDGPEEFDYPVGLGILLSL